MFTAPSKGNAQVAPAEEIDVNERYILRLESLHDEGPGKFPDQRTGEPVNRIRWAFRVYHTDKTPVLTVDNDPWEFWTWTSSRTGKSTNGVGKTATARIYMEALLGRALEDDEISQKGFEQTLIGKVAVALFENNEVEDASGQTYSRLKILRLSPYKGDKPAAAPAPRPEPKPEPKIEPLADSIPF